MGLSWEPIHYSVRMPGSKPDVARGKRAPLHARDRAKPTRENSLRIPQRDKARLRWMIPGASHSLPLERPHEVVQLMVELIRSVEST